MIKPSLMRLEHSFKFVKKNHGNLTVVPEYIFGGLVAFVPCFVGFVVFKKTQQSPTF